MKPVFDEEGLATEPGNIRVYYFSPDTREYTGYSDEYIHTGVSMPGHSTDIVPGDEVGGAKLLCFRMACGSQKRTIEAPLFIQQQMATGKQ